MKRMSGAITGILLAVAVHAADDPGGFNGALWGQTPDEVRSKSGITAWQSDPSEKNFPPELEITVYRAATDIAGYKTSNRYYFQGKRFFQATVDFNLDDLKRFDFNYNVFRSVNEYYTAIRSKVTLLVDDVYDLLRKKYGMREPVFEGLDPRRVFTELDRYVIQERWNLRYHPYDYYCNIVTASYARWDFPHTRVLFSLNIAAPQKRFDCQLSLSSVNMTVPLRKAMDAVRAKGL